MLIFSDDEGTYEVVPRQSFIILGDMLNSLLFFFAGVLFPGQSTILSALVEVLCAKDYRDIQDRGLSEN